MIKRLKVILKRLTADCHALFNNEVVSTGLSVLPSMAFDVYVSSMSVIVL